MRRFKRTSWLGWVLILSLAGSLASADAPPPQAPAGDPDAAFVEACLGKEVEFIFAGEAVRVVIEYFGDRTGLSIVFDRRLLEQENWGDPIELEQPKTTVGAALKKVLDSHQMSMVRQGRVLWICRAQDAKTLEAAFAREAQAEQQAAEAAAKLKPVVPQPPPPEPKPATPTEADQKAALALDTVVSPSWRETPLNQILDAAGKVAGSGWKIDPACDWSAEDIQRECFSIQVADESSYEVLLQALHKFELTWRWEAGTLVVIPRPRNTVRDLPAENAWVRQQMNKRITFRFDTDAPLAEVVRVVASHAGVRMIFVPRLNPSNLTRRPVQVAVNDVSCQSALTCALHQAGAQASIRFGTLWISEIDVNPLPPGIDANDPDGMFVLEHLQKRIDYRFDEDTLLDAVEYLLQRAGVTGAFDPQLLADPRFKAKVRLTAEDDKIMNVLAAVLAQCKLGCALQGRILWICRQEEEAALRKKFATAAPGVVQPPAQPAEPPADRPGAQTGVGDAVAAEPSEDQVRRALGVWVAANLPGAAAQKFFAETPFEADPNGGRSIGNFTCQPAKHTWGLVVDGGGVACTVFYTGVMVRDGDKDWKLVVKSTGYAMPPLPPPPRAP